MATAMREVLICDFDDQLASATVNFMGPDGKMHQLDVCAGTLRDFIRKSHPPRRGRRPGIVVKRTAAKKATTKKASTRKRSRKRA